MSNRIFNQIIIGDGYKKDFLIRHNLNREDINLSGFDFQRGSNMYGIPYTIVNNNEILIHFTEPLDKYFEYKITVSTEFIHQIDDKKDKYYIKQYRFLRDEEQKLSDEEISGLPFEYIHKDEYRKQKKAKEELYGLIKGVRMICESNKMAQFDNIEDSIIESIDKYLKEIEDKYGKINE